MWTNNGTCSFDNERCRLQSKEATFYHFNAESDSNHGAFCQSTRYLEMVRLKTHEERGWEGLVQNSLFSFLFPYHLQTRCVSCPLSLIFICDLIHFFGERWWCAGSYTHLKSLKVWLLKKVYFCGCFHFWFVFDFHEKMWVCVMVSVVVSVGLVLLIVLYLLVPLSVTLTIFQGRSTVSFS